MMLPLPPVSDFANFSSWEQWIIHFEDIRYASALHCAAGKVQVQTLLYITDSHEARRILDTPALSFVTLTSLDTVKGSFTEHLVHPANKVYTSVTFHCRIQEPRESISTSFTALWSLAEKCDYSSAVVEEPLVQDRVVTGLRDKTVVDRLCRSARLSLDEAHLEACVHKDATLFADTPNVALGHVIPKAHSRASEG